MASATTATYIVKQGTRGSLSYRGTRNSRRAIQDYDALVESSLVNPQQALSHKHNHLLRTEAHQHRLEAAAVTDEAWTLDLGLCWMHIWLKVRRWQILQISGAAHRPLCARRDFTPWATRPQSVLDVFACAVRDQATVFSTRAPPPKSTCRAELCGSEQEGE